VDAAEATNTERFKETIVKEWTDPATVAAWRGWHPKFALQSTEATEAIVRSEGQAGGRKRSAPSVGRGPVRRTKCGSGWKT
jgi:hypothetical protein